MSGSFDHRLLVYDDEEDLLEVAVPFLTEVRERGEAAVLAVGPHLMELLRGAIGPDAGVSYDLEYRLPVTTLERRREQALRLLENGARGVRVLGEVPHPGIGSRPWEPWAQYEAAINELYADLPLTGLCVYDRRTASARTLRHARRLHPAIADRNGTLPNRGYDEPRRFLQELAERPDPLEATPPQVELLGVREPRPVRVGMREEARRLDLGGSEMDDFVLALNEVVGDAILRGAGPVGVRAWLSPERLVGHVEYPQRGPDPLSGFLLPPRRETGGLRLPIARRFCRQLDIRGDGGCRIRVVSYPVADRSPSDTALSPAGPDHSGGPPSDTPA